MIFDYTNVLYHVPHHISSITGISKNPNGRNKLHSDINMFKKITKKSNNSDLINIVRSVNFMVKSDPVKDLSDDEMSQGFDLRIRMVHLDSFYRNNHRSIIYQFQVGDIQIYLYVCFIV